MHDSLEWGNWNWSLLRQAQRAQTPCQPTALTSPARHTDAFERPGFSSRGFESSPPTQEGPSPSPSSFPPYPALPPKGLSNKGHYSLVASDETNVLHLLPTFLAKIPPSRNLTDPCEVAHMVRHIRAQHVSCAPHSSTKYIVHASS